ncbi:hypothetical protein ACN20G_27700 (plasmid) [Streptomyces sp. BI20]|uniref:hypothetical protein n=1 Tax=Streptomyces sp. BI20 TaxID=3403460 RepID=UPI003C7409E6
MSMNRSSRIRAGVLGGVVALVTIAGVAVVSAADGGAPREGARGSGAAVVTTAWAKVSAGGTVLGGAGITGINKFGIGRYNITTSSDLGNCALLGTINTNGGNDPGPGSASILVGKVNGNTLFIRTATPSASGNAIVDSDRPFSIQIVC